MQEFVGVIYFHVNNTLQMNDYRHYQLISLLLYYRVSQKKRTFRIIILQAAAPGRSDSTHLKYDLPEAAACRMMILKVRFFGTPCRYYSCPDVWGKALSLLVESPRLQPLNICTTPKVFPITSQLFPKWQFGYGQT